MVELQCDFDWSVMEVGVMSQQSAKAAHFAKVMSVTETSVMLMSSMMNVVDGVMLRHLTGVDSRSRCELLGNVKVAIVGRCR